MQEPLLAIARIAAPHGLGGEVKAQILTDFPQRFRKTAEVWVGEPPGLFRVERARVSGGHVLLKLEGVVSREQAETLRGQLVQVPESQGVPLARGQYFWHQVIGLEVRDQEGVLLGHVAEIIETGSNHVYVVRGERGEWLIPAIKQVVKRIAPDANMLQVVLLPGMEPVAPRPRSRARKQATRLVQPPGG